MQNDAMKLMCVPGEKVHVVCAQVIAYLTFNTSKGLSKLLSYFGFLAWMF